MYRPVCAGSASCACAGTCAPGAAFNGAKGAAIIGLTFGYLLWQVGLIGIGGEWFGMWMSPEWNGVESAFRFLMMTLGGLIYVGLPDRDMTRDSGTAEWRSGIHVA